MSESPTPVESDRTPPRGCVLAVAAFAALGLFACLGATWFLLGHRFELMAWSLRQGRERVEASIATDVDGALRLEFLREYDAQVDYLVTLDDRELEGDAALKAASAAQRLGESLRDEVLTEAEMRDFVEHSRSVREGSPDEP